MHPSRTLSAYVTFDIDSAVMGNSKTVP